MLRYLSYLSYPFFFFFHLLSVLLLPWVEITAAPSDPHTRCPILAIHALGRHGLWQPLAAWCMEGTIPIPSSKEALLFSSLWSPLLSSKRTPIKLKILIVILLRVVAILSCFPMPFLPNPPPPPPLSLTSLSFPPFPTEGREYPYLREMRERLISEDDPKTDPQSGDPRLLQSQTHGAPVGTVVKVSPPSHGLMGRS